jgi:glycosyltransferase involved in cell wall biosynthesis
LTRTYIPQEILAAAHERSAARAARAWDTADRLRAEIEAAGWRVIDAGTDFRLEPAHAPDLEEAGRVRYGRSTAVPSRLDEAPVGLATVVLVTPDDAAGIARAVSGLRAAAPSGTSIVVVDDGSDAEAAPILAELGQAPAPGAAEPVEVVSTSARLGQGAGWNIGIRRASAPIVILLDGSIEPTGDVVSPLVAALDDPAVAVAGAFGLATDDLRRFHEVESGPVAAVEGYLMAFRRSEAAARGPLDERFLFYRNLDIWWSLVLRDEGRDVAPRRALVVPRLPLIRHEHPAWERMPSPERERLSKRNFYRVLDRFGARQDLAVPGE